MLWGLPLATAVSVASMLAFNWFFLPPTHTFQLQDTANWLALAVYLVTGVVVSVLATQARRRSELAAERTVEAEAIRRSDTIKTAVLRAVSHDLRSPLTAIVAAASGLGNPELKLARADRDDLVATIRAEAERLDRIVGQPARPLAPDAAASPSRIRSCGRPTISSRARSTSSARAASGS